MKSIKWTVTLSLVASLSGCVINSCDWAQPIYPQRTDRPSEHLARQVVIHNETGARLCQGWRSQPGYVPPPASISFNQSSKNSEARLRAGGRALEHSTMVVSCRVQDTPCDLAVKVGFSPHSREVVTIITNGGMISPSPSIEGSA